jgi:hypothetical protein
MMRATVIRTLIELGLEHDEATKIASDLQAKLDAAVLARNAAARNTQHWNEEYDRLDARVKQLEAVLAEEAAVPLHTVGTK